MTKEYNFSIKCCQPLGIIKKEFVEGSLIKSTKVLIITIVKSEINKKFVIDKSKPAKVKLKKGAILNWSNGLYNILNFNFLSITEKSFK